MLSWNHIVAGVVLLILDGQSMASAVMTVVGWDFSAVHEAEAPLDFGNDPVVGRLICPPLTRLDLYEQSSEPFVLKSITISSDESEWTLALRPSVLWWSGETVGAEGLRKFIQEQLSVGLLRDRLAVLWTVPGFKVEIFGTNSVKIVWKTPPVFGPYIFDGVSLSRPSSVAQKERSRINFECVGRYSAKLEGAAVLESLLLEPTKSLGGASRLVKLFSEAQKGIEAAVSLDFKTASQVGRDLGPKGVQESLSCNARLELPVMTLILWNSNRPTAKDASLRRLFTQLTPRGELLRTGAGGFGELLSVPVPRSHPGYDNTIKVRSFSIEEAAASLDALGYRRTSPEKSRGDKSGEVLKLLVSTQKGSSGLAEKIVSDSFNAVGIDLRVESNEKLYSDKADGQILSWPVPWPALNLAGVFHSRSRHPWKPWLPHTPRLDSLLEEYALSLSRGRPNFGALRLVHQEMFDLEPATVLMQHKACLKAGNSLVGKTANINIRDPDWFWRIIF